MRSASVVVAVALGGGGVVVVAQDPPRVVDVARYPIDALDSPRGREIVARARAELRASGVATLPGFLTPRGVAAAIAECDALAGRAHATDATHNAYQLAGVNDTLAARHVRNARMRTRVASIATADLAPDGPVRRVYSDALAALVARVTATSSSVSGGRHLDADSFDENATTLFRLADPLGAASVNVFEPGWEHAWHFDEAEYTTTLSLQTADAGGAFEFTPPLRSSQADLAVADVARVVNAHSQYDVLPVVVDDDDDVCAGDDDEAMRRRSPPSRRRTVAVAPFEPGTLQIFAGRYSLHRVTRVQGTRRRLVAVYCFADRPDFVNSPEVQQMFWGRVAREAVLPEDAPV